MHFNIIDFRACVKHAYYGAKDPEAIGCEKTGRFFPHWEVGAADFITRYIRPLIEAGESFRDLIVVHDMGREYRTTMFPDYKGQKSKKEENKSPIEIEQVDKLFDWAKKFLAGLGIVQIGVNGVEADDIIAWIVQRMEAVGYTCIVHSVDQDLLVLVSDLTSVSLKGKVFFGADAVYPDEHELAEMPLKLTSLAKSIIGDASDNYGGVRGMGVAALRKLIDAFGYDGLEELQGIVASGNTDVLDEVINDTGNKGLIKLKAQFSEWKMGWRLANLKPELCWKPRKRKLIQPIFIKRVPNAKYVFNSLCSVGCKDMWDDPNFGFDALLPNPIAITAENWAEMREDILREIAISPITAFDYESSDKEPIMAFREASPSGRAFVDNLSQVIAGASFQFGRHLENVIYIPVDHDCPHNLPAAVILELLMHAAKTSQLVAHNAYFEGIVTKTNLGVWLQNVRDTRVMKRHYDENSPAGLKFLSKEYLLYDQTSYEDTMAAAGKSLMCELTLDEVFKYGADDSLVTGHLYDLLMLQLILDEQWAPYEQMAVRPTEVLQRGYVHGVNINWALQRRLHQDDLDSIESGMRELREILEKNVSGNITDGCKSFLAAERDFVYRSAERQAKGADAKENQEIARQKLGEWRVRTEAGCQYTPYRVEKVMPKFAFTVKQIEAAAIAVGLPAPTTLSYKGWQAYCEMIGAVGFQDEWPLKPDQVELVDTVTIALQSNCNKITEMRKDIDELEAEHDGETATTELKALRQKLHEAEVHMLTMAEVVQRLAKVEPKEVSFGDELNVGSSVQMQHLLYCKIGVPVRLFGKKIGINRIKMGLRNAGPATDEKAIETAIANDVKEDWQLDALSALLRVKSATTRCSLYHDKYPLFRHRDGRIHPFITDFGTDTGRPTATSINVLAVSKGGVGLRSVFVPPNRDYLCVAIDYSGQELRILACEANDPVMIDAYNNPAGEKDLHSVTGSGIAASKGRKTKGKEAEDLTALGDFATFNKARKLEDHPLHPLAAAIRKSAKPVNFGLAYGAGPGTLSRNLIIPMDEAKELLDGAMELYAQIPVWQKKMAAFMETNGYTLTAFGTKRHATKDIFSEDQGKVARQYRQGANFVIQGTAADMLRKVLTYMAESGIMDRLRMEFFAPIYDEIVSWVHKDDVLAYCQEIGKAMADSTPEHYPVKQVPEFSIGPDWGNVHELGRDISPENVAKVVARSLEEAADIWDKDMLEPFNPILKNGFRLELTEDEADPEAVLSDQVECEDLEQLAEAV